MPQGDAGELVPQGDGGGPGDLNLIDHSPLHSTRSGRPPARANYCKATWNVRDARYVCRSWVVLRQCCLPVRMPVLIVKVPDPGQVGVPGHQHAIQLAGLPIWVMDGSRVKTWGDSAGRWRSAW